MVKSLGLGRGERGERARGDGAYSDIICFFFFFFLYGRLGGFSFFLSLLPFWCLVFTICGSRIVSFGRVLSAFRANNCLHSGP